MSAKFKLYELFSGVQELAAFLKEKVYEVTNDPSYTFYKKIEIFCIHNGRPDLKTFMMSILSNIRKIGLENIIKVYDFAKSLGYEGEKPELKAIILPRSSSKLGFFDREFVILNKKIFINE